MMTYIAPARQTRCLNEEEYRHVAYAELLNHDRMRKLMRRIKRARNSEEIRKILNEQFVV